MSLKKKNSLLMTAESEELDYEGDEANSPVKKHADALEKEKDLEEGEILDANEEDCPKKRVCYFFQRGECRLGDKCSGLHVTDCLYKLIDSPPALSSESQNSYHCANPHANNFSLLHTMMHPSATFQIACSTTNISNLGNYEQCESTLTEWDRALIEAKKLVNQFDKKSNRICPPVTITIESDDERLSDKSKKKPRRYQSPSPEMLPRDSSLTDNVKKSPKRKLTDNKNNWRRANKWHDPWRRSPVHPTKSVPSSPVPNSRSPQCRKPNYNSIFEKQRCKIVGNQNKSISRRSLSSSSSSTSIHQPRKSSLKPMQKENVSPSIEVKKLNPSISKRESPKIAKKRQTNFHRSSSSSSRASIHRSIKENLKIIQEKKSSTVGNKLGLNFKMSISDRRPRKISENWHRTVFRRSSSCSSRASTHRTIKDNSKTIQEKITSVGNKPDKNVKLSGLRARKIAEDRRKANSRRSSTSSSPPSVRRSREIWSKSKTKPQSSKQEKKIPPAVPDRNSKSNERIKEKFPSSSVMSVCRSNDVSQWTPKKVGPRTPAVKSCSDMSISPLTDSSLSDIFDPDKKANGERTCRYEASRSRSFVQPRKKSQAEVYGPICPPNNQMVAPSISETRAKVIPNNKFAIEKLSGTTKIAFNSPDCATKNKTVDVSKSKQVKKRKFSRNLEADLFKFHPLQILSDDDQQKAANHREPILPNVVQQKSTGHPEPIIPCNIQRKMTETRINKTPKKSNQSRKIPETKNNEMREVCLTQSRQRSRKEEILQQLEALNAAIARKKTLYAARK